MRDGLYGVEFRTRIGDGAGVVVLDGGRIRGGDSGMYYWGTYSVSGDEFRATLQIDRHSRTAAMASVFGVDRVQIDLVGKWAGDQATTQGSSPQAPGMPFSAQLTRLQD